MLFRRFTYNFFLFILGVRNFGLYDVYQWIDVEFQSKKKNRIKMCVRQNDCHAIPILLQRVPLHILYINSELFSIIFDVLQHFFDDMNWCFSHGIALDFFKLNNTYCDFLAHAYLCLCSCCINNGVTATIFNIECKKR